MRAARALLLLALAAGLPSLLAWKAFSRSGAAAAEARRWVCPMRCLGRVYDHPGRCPVCHMELHPVGTEVSGTVAEPRPEAWPRLAGKTAVYFRPYTVQAVQVDQLLRVAGTLSRDGLRLRARVPLGEPVPRRGASAMLMPALGYARPVLGRVERVDAKRGVLILASRPLAGFEEANVEIRLAAEPSPAVPNEAVVESEGRTWVYVLDGDGPEASYKPRRVTVGRRGERFMEVTAGLTEGETVAGAGLFWLESQWRFDHPLAGDL
jgi:hypothetical protein